MDIFTNTIIITIKSISFRIKSQQNQRLIFNKFLYLKFNSEFVDRLNVLCKIFYAITCRTITHFQQRMNSVLYMLKTSRCVLEENSLYSDLKKKMRKFVTIGTVGLKSLHL